VPGDVSNLSYPSPTTPGGDGDEEMVLKQFAFTQSSDSESELESGSESGSESDRYQVMNVPKVHMAAMHPLMSALVSEHGPSSTSEGVLGGNPASLSMGRINNENSSDEASSESEIVEDTSSDSGSDIDKIEYLDVTEWINKNNT
jgi:hypothetical protein